ncbi:MAG: flavodoxin [Chloroflexota bacterium]
MTVDSNYFQIDESDPHYLLISETGDHPEPDDYRALMRRWLARVEEFEQGENPQRFGLVIVHGRHEHDHEDGDDHDHEHERDGDREAEFTKLINDFRRDYRDRVSVACSGYANIYAAEDIRKWYGEGEEGLTKMQENMERFAQYSFGIPAGVFTDVESAKKWLIEQASVASPPATNGHIPATSNQQLATKIGLFYGSTTGVTEYVADRIEDAWEAITQQHIMPINITNIDDAELLTTYKQLILGIPTWNIGQLQDDWEIVFPELDNLDFDGIQVAIFGVGDARGYPQNFLDAVGMLGKKLRERGAQLAGYWPTEGYEFTESKALENGKFMGLGIDEVSQADQTEARIAHWVTQLVGEFKLEAVVA